MDEKLNTKTAVVLSTVFSIMTFPAMAEDVDLEVIHRIKEQAFRHSRVMDYMHMLADENGPRVSGSPGYRQAAEKAVVAFQEAGVAQAGLETWGYIRSRLVLVTDCSSNEDAGENHPNRLSS